MSGEAGRCELSPCFCFSLLRPAEEVTLMYVGDDFNESTVNLTRYQRQTLCGAVWQCESVCVCVCVCISVSVSVCVCVCVCVRVSTLCALV